MSDISNEEARNLVATMKHELEGLTDTEPVSGYAAEDEIREAVEHLDAAIVDLDNAILNEDDDDDREEDHVPVWERNVNE